jgi:hypothetical protein
MNSDPHRPLVDGCEHVNEIDQRRKRSRARISPFDQGGDHRTIDRTDQRADQLDMHRPAGPLDGFGYRFGALPQAPAHRFAQGGQTGTRDVALVSRYQLLGESRSGHVPHQQVHQHFRGGLRAPAAPRQCSDSCAQLRYFDHPYVFDRACDQIVEGREVVRGRRQRQASTPGYRPVPHSFEPAFAKQLGGRAHQRIPAAFSFWSNCCSHD